MNEVERLFNSDINQKKKAGRGIHNRASRKGFIKGGVKTQSDFMTKKQIKELNGEVKVYKMYESIKEIKDVPSLEEIESKNEKIVIETMKYLKENFKTKDLANHWGLCYNSILDVFGKYKLYTPRVSMKPGLYSSINEIPTLEEFNKMNATQQKGMLVALRQQFTVNAIAQQWGTDRNGVYSFLRKHDLVKTNKNNPTNNVKKEIKQKDDVQIEIPIETLSEKPSEVIENNEQASNEILNILKQLVENKVNEPEKKNTYNGFNISLNGEYDNVELENKLLSIANVISSNKKYKISLELSEVI